MKIKKTGNDRRAFLSDVATGAAALGLLSIPTTLIASAKLKDKPGNEWYDRINGKHRVVFDAPRPHELYPFVWPRVFLVTNAATGTPEKENSVVVVLRHTAIGYAMNDELWTKYNFGELFEVMDPSTKKSAEKNPFWKPAPGTYKVPGIGQVEIGINELQASGVQFVVCDAAMTVFSAALADKMKQDAAIIKQEWVKGILPGITPVPSGVWALGRAQEHGCAYIFAG